MTYVLCYQACRLVILLIFGAVRNSRCMLHSTALLHLTSLRSESAKGCSRKHARAWLEKEAPL